MAKSKKFTVRFRRRRESRTDYKARLRMLRGGKERVIVRKTNKYIIGQFIRSDEAKDKIIVGLSSKDLLDYGWPNEAKGSLKSLPASYLTGLLLGEKILDKEEKVNAVLDIGLIRNLKKSRIYSFLKGLIDAGIKIPCKEEIFPDENRISGKHMKKNINFEKIKEKILKEY